MKVEELRLGNWLYDKTYFSTDPKNYNYNRIDTIQVDSIWHGYNNKSLINIHSEGSAYGDSSIEGTELSDCAPIPLSEDILLKCGFEKKVKKHKQTYWSLNDDLRIYHAINSLVCFQSNKSPFWHSLCTINYVHQLQNLYFCLTGNELSITI